MVNVFKDDTAYTKNDEENEGNHRFRRSNMARNLLDNNWIFCQLWRKLKSWEVEIRACLQV